MDVIATALYTRLSGDTGTGSLTALGSTGTYQGIAPRDATYPFVTFQLADGFDRRVFGASASEWTEWIVKAWDRGLSHKRAKQMADRINVILDESEANLSVSGHAVMCLRRIRTLPDMTEQDEGQGVMYRSSGARYEVEVRDA